MAAEYKLTATEGVVRHFHDGTVSSIPNDPENTDRKIYEAWLAAGGVPDPYVKPLNFGETITQRLGAR